MGSPTRPTGFDDSALGEYHEAKRRRGIAAAEFLGLPLDKVLEIDVDDDELNGCVHEVTWEATAMLSPRYGETRHGQRRSTEGSGTWRSTVELSYPRGREMLEVIGRKPQVPPHPMEGRHTRVEASMDPSARAAVVAVLDEMRQHGRGPTLYYAEKLAQALGEPQVITQEVIESGRLT